MNQPDIRVAIRGYKNGEQIFEDVLDIAWNQGGDDLISDAARRHADVIQGSLHMIEIEFLDEEDPDQRFFRIGNDPRRMVAPVRVV